MKNKERVQGLKESMERRFGLKEIIGEGEDNILAHKDGKYYMTGYADGVNNAEVFEPVPREDTFEMQLLFRCKECGALYEKELELKGHDCRIARKTDQLGTR